MPEHPINSLMDTTIKKIKDLVDTNTIIGDPITTPDGATILPVSKVTYGFASGGSDLPTKKEIRESFGGGGGAGVTIQPLGFLTIVKGSIRFIAIENYKNAIDRVAGIIPDVVDKVSDAITGSKNGKTDDEIDKELEAIGSETK